MMKYAALQAVLAISLAAQVRGRVSDETGAAVAGATVLAQSATAPGEPAQATSGSNGSYTISGLASGQYQICALVAGSDFLSTCQWQPAIPLTVTVKSGQPLNNVDITLRRGRKVEVRADDPSQTLAAAAPNSHLLVGIWDANGVFQPAPVAATDAQGRTYAIVVPYDTNLRLGVSGRKLMVEDAAGKTVAESAPGVPFSAPKAAGSSTLSFRYVVRGMVQ